MEIRSQNETYWEGKDEEKISGEMKKKRKGNLVMGSKEIKRCRGKMGQNMVGDGDM